MEMKFTRARFDILSELSAAKMELLHRRQTTKLIASIVIAILFLSGGILTIDYFGSFWNFLSAIGISFLYTLYIYFRQRIKFRKEALLDIRGKVIKFTKQKNIAEFLFTEDFLSYKDKEVTYQATWSSYTHYLEYKDYLFFINDKVTLVGLAIGKRELPVDLYQELLILLGRKLPKLER
jgi:hypothetical protein